METLPDHVSYTRAADFLGVSRQTIYRRIHSGTLKAFDISEPGAGQPTMRIRRADLEALVRPAGYLPGFER